MPAVSLQHLAKTFGTQREGGAVALADLSLDVEAGELLVLLGPSGCGKTTILRCIAGLERPTSGRILIGDVDVTERAPKDRDVAMVFQSYALYPHLTARENIAFPLRMRRVPAAEASRRVADAAALLGIGALLGRRPAALSGGERQRVALGRAIVRQPAAFLFDEPLSNLDAALRASMRADLLALHRRLGKATIFVTHDQIEAMTMGRRIAVMDQGRVQQVGTPQEIYGRPATAFVARFVGSPGMNLVPETGFFTGFRPEAARLAAPAGSRWTGSVVLVEPLGPETLVHVRLSARTIVVIRHREGELPGLEGEVGVTVPEESLHRFDAVNGSRL